MAEKLINDIMSVADRTGMPDAFVQEHLNGLVSPLPAVDMDKFDEEEPLQPAFEAAPKTMYEKLFGYDPRVDIPADVYANGNPLQRKVMEAQLVRNNAVTRMGIGATKQSKGTLKFFMPKSMEEFFELEKIGTKDSPLDEDVYYERGQQMERCHHRQGHGPGGRRTGGLYQSVHESFNW